MFDTVKIKLTYPISMKGNPVLNFMNIGCLSLLSMSKALKSQNHSEINDLGPSCPSICLLLIECKSGIGQVSSIQLSLGGWLLR